MDFLIFFTRENDKFLLHCPRSSLGGFRIATLWELMESKEGNTRTMLAQAFHKIDHSTEKAPPRGFARDHLRHAQVDLSSFNASVPDTTSSVKVFNQYDPLVHSGRDGSTALDGSKKPKGSTAGPNREIGCRPCFQPFVAWAQRCPLYRTAGRSIEEFRTFVCQSTLGKIQTIGEQAP